MSNRAEQLRESADQQVVEFLRLASAQTPETLRQPCPGWQKLGDGSVGALIAHTAENYKRIADYAAGNSHGHVPRGGAHNCCAIRRGSAVSALNWLL